MQQIKCGKNQIVSYRGRTPTIIWRTKHWGWHLSNWWNIQGNMWGLIHIMLICCSSLYHWRKTLKTDKFQPHLDSRMVVDI